MTAPVVQLPLILFVWGYFTPVSVDEALENRNRLSGDHFVQDETSCFIFPITSGDLPITGMQGNRFGVGTIHDHPDRPARHVLVDPRPGLARPERLGPEFLLPTHGLFPSFAGSLAATCWSSRA